MRLLSLSLVLVLCQILTPTIAGETGAYVRLNQKAVDYLAEIASDGLPQLLENVTLPSFDASLATVTPHIDHFARPSIRARFMRGRGVRASLVIPKIVVDTQASISLLVFTIKENALITVEDIDITMQLRFARNTTTNINEIAAEECTVKPPKTTIVFQEDSEMKEYESTIKTNIADALKSAVCTTAVEALVYIDQQQLQKDPLATEPPPTEEPVPGAFSDFSADEFASDLCAGEVEEGATTTTISPSNLRSPIQTGPPWSIDLTMTQLPTFTDQDVTFGVNGGILLAGVNASGVEPPRPLNASLLGNKMIGVMVTDYVPNTFFSHVFDFGIGEIDYRLHPEAFPGSIRPMVKLLCGKCHLQVNGELIRKPLVEIDEKLGARVLLEANVSVVFHGRETEYDVINATTLMHLTLRPVIRNSHVYGDVSLTSVDFDIKSLGMGGALASPLRKTLSFVVPRTLWPTIKKRLRFALHQRGIKLPILCGVQLNALSLSYTSRAAVLQSDFTFDLDLFVRKFKAYANRKTLAATGVALYQ